LPLHPGISEATKNPEARNEENATKSIEGIEHSLRECRNLKTVIRIRELSNLGHAMHKTGFFIL